MILPLIKQYHRFLKRSLHTFEHDISQPYHKVIDLLFKLSSLGLAISGAYLLITATNCYFAVGAEMTPSYCTPIFDRVAFGGGAALFEVTLMRWLWGAGYMLVALFISQILVVRHLNETLPDHIYLRCFATEEEKKKRLPVKGKV